MYEWTIEEAVILSFGKNPQTVSFKKLEQKIFYLSPFFENCKKLMEIVSRAEKNKLFTDKIISVKNDHIKPYMYVNWMQKNELSFPKPLAEKVLKFYQINKPLKTTYELSMEHIQNSMQNTDLKSQKTQITQETIVESNYIPPYVKLMLRASTELGLSPDERIPIKKIKAWLHENWPDYLEGKSDRIISNIATLLRRPEDKKGGNTSWKNKRLSPLKASVSLYY